MVQTFDISNLDYLILHILQFEIAKVYDIYIRKGVRKIWQTRETLARNVYGGYTPAHKWIRKKLQSTLKACIHLLTLH